MKNIFVLIPLLVFLQSSQAFLWFGDKTKTKTTDEQRHSFDSSNQNLESFVKGERAQVPTVTVAGTNNSATVTVTGNPDYTEKKTAGQKAATDTTSSDATSSFYKSTLPISIAIFFFALSGFLLLALIKAWRAYSPTVNAAIGHADTHVASLIERLDNKAADETDPSKLAFINNLRASVEKTRGKIRSYNPSRKNT